MYVVVLLLILQIGWLMHAGFEQILVLSNPVVFYAVFFWNSFLPGLIYITDARKLPLQTVLYNVVKTADATESGVLAYMPEGIKMATAFITVFPILLVYPFLQKHFTKGVLLGSVKG